MSDQCKQCREREQEQRENRLRIKLQEVCKNIMGLRYELDMYTDDDFADMQYEKGPSFPGEYVRRATESSVENLERQRLQIIGTLKMLRSGGDRRKTPGRRRAERNRRQTFLRRNLVRRRKTGNPDRRYGETTRRRCGNRRNGFERRRKFCMRDPDPVTGSRRGPRRIQDRRWIESGDRRTGVPERRSGSDRRILYPGRRRRHERRTGTDRRTLDVLTD